MLNMKNNENPNEEPILRLEAFLPYRLMVAAEKISLGFSKIYKEKYDLSRPEWRVLATLAQFKRATATEVGAHSSMHKTKVSRAVFVLEKRKWLVRKTDESDRRVEWLELTREGKAKFLVLAKLAREYESQVVALLGINAFAKLDEALARVEDLQISM
jgi:DNA-binding MarR family transcriptional regulator